MKKSTQNIINEIIQLKTQPPTDTTKLKIQKLQQKLQTLKTKL